MSTPTHGYISFQQDDSAAEVADLSDVDVDDDVADESDVEELSDLMNSVSSVLQGFAFQQHLTSDHPLKFFPILIKAEQTFEINAFKNKFSANLIFSCHCGQR